MTPDGLKAEIDRINALSGTDALSLVKTLIADAAEKIVLLAAAWARAESQGKGHDLACLRHGLFRYIPMVADGRVMPQMVVMFGGAISVLGLVAGLKTSHQKEIADGKRYDFATFRDGQFDVIKVTLPDLHLNQVRQLIDGTEIRSIAAQRAHLEASSTPRRTARAHLEASSTPRRTGASVTHGGVVVDTKTQTVRIGKSSAPAVDVIRALATAGLIDPPLLQRR